MGAGTEIDIRFTDRRLGDFIRCRVLQRQPDGMRFDDQVRPFELLQLGQSLLNRFTDRVVDTSNSETTEAIR